MGPQIYRLSRSPLLLIATALTLLFLLSSFSRSDPTSSSFQFPSLRPSRYPPSRILSSLVLTPLLQDLHQNLTVICPGANQPVYPSPGLTFSQEKRYTHLREEGRYMLVTTIREIQGQLPDLLNTILVLTAFLTPQRLVFSIFEGPSDDCTSSAFELVLLPLLSSLGVSPSQIHLHTRAPPIDFNQHNRIQALADLRNRAFAPIWEDTGRELRAVVAFNDVYLRPSDVLELLHQHVKAGEKSGVETGITTGMDYYERSPEWYYDVWVGRTVSETLALDPAADWPLVFLLRHSIVPARRDPSQVDTGDLFYPISTPWWTPSDSLFSTSPSSLSHYQSLRPFQVYASWNGLAVLSPKPFLPPHNVRFRRGDVGRGECTASECGLVSQDFWKAGMGRVQIVPTVQVRLPSIYGMCS